MYNNKHTHTIYEKKKYIAEHTYISFIWLRIKSSWTARVFHSIHKAQSHTERQWRLLFDHSGWTNCGQGEINCVADLVWCVFECLYALCCRMAEKHLNVIVASWFHHVLRLRTQSTLLSILFGMRFKCWHSICCFYLLIHCLMCNISLFFFHGPYEWTNIFV